MKAEEKRSYPRISINTHCLVFLETSDGVREVAGIVRDFSDGGLCISIENTPDNEKLLEDTSGIRVAFHGPASTSMEKAEFSFSLFERWTKAEEDGIRIGGEYELL